MQDRSLSADTCPQPSKVPGTRKVLNEECGEERKGRREAAGQSAESVPCPRLRPKSFGRIMPDGENAAALEPNHNRSGLCTCSV